jgi:hypothetical protein
MSDAAESKVRLFISYGRADAEALAERLEADLSLIGFDVWRDRREIRSGREEAGLRQWASEYVPGMSASAVRHLDRTAALIGFPGKTARSLPFPSSRPIGFHSKSPFNVGTRIN